MIIFPKRFKEIILIGFDYDLVNELNINKIKIIGYTSKTKKDVPYKFLGSVSNLKNLDKSFGLLITTDDIELREFAFTNFQEQICTFVSFLSFVSKNMKIGLGSILQANTFVSDNTKIGRCVKINVGSQIHHDSVVGDFSVLGPKVVILGNSIVKKKCFIGSGAIIRNKISLAQGTFIGMGSVVTKNTEKNKIYYGNPAKLINNLYTK